MKKLLLLFAAICCTAMMQAEIVYHAKCEPTRQRGFTQDCWEDTETGKIYSDQACTNELNAAKVVQYSKLANGPVITADHMFTYKPTVNYTQGACLMGDVTHEGVQFHNAIRIYHSFWGAKYENIYFKVTGANPRNARLKMYVQRYDNAKNGNIYFSLFRNGKWIIGGEGYFTDGFMNFALPEMQNLNYGDEIKLQWRTEDIHHEGDCKYTTIDVCLEYEADNQFFITADNLKKIKGEADPVLTWTEKGDLLDGEKVNAILSRTAGEEPGEYPIHVTYQTENLGSDAEIITQDATFTIFDGGIHHHQSEPTESQIGYAQDCWEDESTGKFYLDGYHTQEVSPAAMILYPKLAESPITQNSGFTIKESETYDGALFNWVAVTNYKRWDQGTRYVEFTVHGDDIVNGRLKWFKDQGLEQYGIFHINIYVNGEQVQRYDTDWHDSDYTLLEGLFSVPLPSLKDGDIVKFQVGKNEPAAWDVANPTIAASLEYLNRKELCLRAEEAGSTIQLNKVGNPYDTSLEYSTTGTKWQPYTFGQTITLANEGDRVYFRKADEGVASGFSTSLFNYYQFAMTGKIAASGNVMSLIDNTCKATTIPNTFCFTNLFYNCQSLTQAPKLPALTLASDCYNRMFENCTKLATAPVLPAKTLKTYCYYFMFRKCTSLTAAPELPATTLAEGCYGYMFDGCTGLTSAPVLSATTMANYCYHVMFKDCTNLTTASALPATTLASNCYREMFSGCTKLETAPVLPATTIAYSCYEKMFSGCSSLTTAPELPATTLEAYSYNSMFEGCTSLTTAPELPATSLQFRCYNNMFNGCTNLNHVKVAFTEWTDNTTVDWLKGVAETGIFVCPDALDKTQTGASYIPEGWTPVFEAKANKDPESENYYSTFYSGTNAYEVPSGVIAYTGAVEESTSNPDVSVLKLTAISDGIIPAEEPVILKAAQSQVYLPYTTETASKNEDNELVGTDEAKTLGTNDYALSLGQNGVGFYLWDGKTIGANKAYLTLDEALGVKALQFRFDDEPATTGINFVNENEDEDENLYNLNGLRVGKDYKGIVIKNGKKVIR